MRFEKHPCGSACHRVACALIGVDASKYKCTRARTHVFALTHAPERNAFHTKAVHALQTKRLVDQHFFAFYVLMSNVEVVQAMMLRIKGMEDRTQVCAHARACLCVCTI